MLKRNAQNLDYSHLDGSILMAGLRIIIGFTLAIFVLLLSVSLANAEPANRATTVNLPGNDGAAGIVRIVECRRDRIPQGGGDSSDPSLVAGNIGMLMDRGDHICVREALDRVVDGLTTVWINESSNIKYLLTPLHSSRPSGESLCRVYTAQALAQGAVLETYQKVCRRSDGTWNVHWGENFK